MIDFAELYARLDSSTRTSEKHDALVDYFKSADPADAAWAVALFTGGRPRRGVSHRLMRSAAAEFTGLPEWLIGESHEKVGDSSESIALLIPDPTSPLTPPPLHRVIEETIRPLRTRSDEDKQETLFEAWRTLAPEIRLVFHKLITGGLRVGVAARSVARALAEIAPDEGIDAAVIEHRLSGNWTPSPESYARLFEDVATAGDDVRPYPFFLASPLEQDPAQLGDTNEWFAEHKWDGVRAQLVRRAGSTTIWSRGDETLADAFPELVQLGLLLPEGTVLDGEILAFERGRPLPFSDLQRRILRKQRDVMLFDDVPAVFMAYDLLESEGIDRRAAPLEARRAMLELLHDEVTTKHGAQRHLALSEIVRAWDWDQLAEERSVSRERGTEGIMLKRRESPYRAGRVRGDWWKWKIDPHTIDAVLIYAQLGSGKRAGRFTDYTFGLWDKCPSQHEDAALLPFTKAYSGLTNEEIERADAIIKKSIIAKHGPIRHVEPSLVFEIAFEGVQRSNRHKAGMALRFPRMSRWRTDLSIREADTIDALESLLPAERSP